MNIKSIAREPLVHFLLIGLVLFLIYGTFAPRNDNSQQIVVSQVVVNEISRQFTSTWSRPPNQEELKNLIDSKAEFQLVDVREDYEFEEANLNGELIPMGDVIDNVEKISRDKQVVIHCRSGKRSANVITTLENKFGFTNLYNLEGGILSYIEQFGL